MREYTPSWTTTYIFFLVQVMRLDETIRVTCCPEWPRMSYNDWLYAQSHKVTGNLGWVSGIPEGSHLFPFRMAGCNCSSDDMKPEAVTRPPMKRRLTYYFWCHSINAWGHQNKNNFFVTVIHRIIQYFKAHDFWTCVLSVEYVAQSSKMSSASSFTSNPLQLVAAARNVARWHSPVESFCGGSTCKSRGAFQYTFLLASVQNQPMRTVATGDREDQTFLEGRWTECIPAIRISPILYVSPPTINKLLYSSRCP